METPFDSVEGAQEYVRLLSEAVLEAQHEVEADALAEANSQFPRRLQALRLVVYNLQKLSQHLKASHRVLNDLRTLRRLLLEERVESASDTSPAAGPDPTDSA